MASAKLNDPERRDAWVAHVEAWRPNGLSMRAYCREHDLSDGIFRRWVLALESPDSLEYAARQALARRSKRREIKLNRSTRNRAAQAFWAMHIEALTWSGMSMRRYAAALNLSEDRLRRWRKLIDDGVVGQDWRALLHPAARPALSTSANDSAKADQGLTNPGEPRSRRSFTPEEKAAIVRETRRGGITVSAVARRHRIVPSVIFRWRAEMGLSTRKPADLVLVTGESGALILEGLMPQPEGTIRMQLSDGRCVFVTAGADRQEVERMMAPQENQT